MLFWGPKPPTPGRKPDLFDAATAFLDLLVSAVKKKALHLQPQDFVNASIPRKDRIDLARALVRGEVDESYIGYAECRICGERLGTADLVGWGFLWPEKAEHYILEHDVWTPECDRLLAAVRST